MHTTTLIALVTVTFLGAGVVKGVTGMGLPTVAMGVLGVFMAPATAATMLLIPSLVTNVGQLLAGPDIRSVLHRLWPMMLCIAAGTMVGSELLVQADSRWSGPALGAALISYAAYALLSPPRSIPARTARALGPAVGLTTGVITGATGVFVIPAVPYLQSLRLGSDELIQSLGLSFTVSTIALASGLLNHGALHVNAVGASALATVPAMAGMRLGEKIREHLQPKRFRQFFLGFLVVLGVTLVCGV